MLVSGVIPLLPPQYSCMGSNYTDSQCLVRSRCMEITKIWRKATHIELERKYQFAENRCQTLVTWPMISVAKSTIRRLSTLKDSKMPFSAPKWYKIRIFPPVRWCVLYSWNTVWNEDTDLTAKNVKWISNQIDRFNADIRKRVWVVGSTDAFRRSQWYSQTNGGRQSGKLREPTWWMGVCRNLQFVHILCQKGKHKLNSSFRRLNCLKNYVPPRINIGWEQVRIMTVTRVFLRSEHQVLTVADKLAIWKANGVHVNVNLWQAKNACSIDKALK